jgi:aminoglycoside phosphotransferase (APT) family kinase protein
MTHGDYRADNILFTADDEVALLDFQLSGTASGAYDLAYFVTQSLEPDVASSNEKALFDRYVAGLRAAGVGADQVERLWEDYRKAALFCLVYPSVAARGMDLADPRQRALVECMNARFARAVEELDLESLL